MSKPLSPLEVEARRQANREAAAQRIEKIEALDRREAEAAARRQARESTQRQAREFKKKAKKKADKKAKARKTTHVWFVCGSDVCVIPRQRKVHIWVRNRGYPSFVWPWVGPWVRVRTKPWKGPIPPLAPNVFTEIG